MLCDMPIEILEIPKDVTSSVHLTVIRLLSNNAKNHQQVFKEMRDAGIGVRCTTARYIYSHTIKSWDLKMAISLRQRLMAIAHSAYQRI